MGIARSIGRARIETSRRRNAGYECAVSPDQLVGRGLKLDQQLVMLCRDVVSPDQLVGRGLKRYVHFACLVTLEYRPINWSGAD